MKCVEMVDRASVQRGVVQAPAKCSKMELPEAPACRLLPAAGTSLLFESHNQHDEVDGGDGAVGSGLGDACGGAGHKMTGILCGSGGDAQSLPCIRNAFSMRLL